MVSKAWMSVLGLISFGSALPFPVAAQGPPDRFPPSPPDVVLSAPARSAGPRALALTDTSGGIPLADGWNLVAGPREPAAPAAGPPPPPGPPGAGRSLGPTRPGASRGRADGTWSRSRASRPIRLRTRLSRR